MLNEFSSLKELYLNLIPAFRVKNRLIKEENLDITNKDIWLYLKENKWQDSYGLTLSDMTSDIINVDPNEILKYKEGL